MEHPKLNNLKEKLKSNPILKLLHKINYNFKSLQIKIKAENIIRLWMKYVERKKPRFPVTLFQNIIKESFWRASMLSEDG